MPGFQAARAIEYEYRFTEYEYEYDEIRCDARTYCCQGSMQLRVLGAKGSLTLRGPSGILVGRNSAFSYSASRYSYSYSKTPESTQVDHLFREAVTPLFGPFVNEIPILLFEYEYRFTEYEY